MPHFIATEQRRQTTGFHNMHTAQLTLISSLSLSPVHWPYCQNHHRIDPAQETINLTRVASKIASEIFNPARPLRPVCSLITNIKNQTHTSGDSPLIHAIRLLVTQKNVPTLGHKKHNTITSFWSHEQLQANTVISSAYKSALATPNQSLNHTKIYKVHLLDNGYKQQITAGTKCLLSDVLQQQHSCLKKDTHLPSISRRPLNLHVTSGAGFPLVRQRTRASVWIAILWCKGASSKVICSAHAHKTCGQFQDNTGEAETEISNTFNGREEKTEVS